MARFARSDGSNGSNDRDDAGGSSPSPAWPPLAVRDRRSGHHVRSRGRPPPACHNRAAHRNRVRPDSPTHPIDTDPPHPARLRFIPSEPGYPPHPFHPIQFRPRPLGPVGNDWQVTSTSRLLRAEARGAGRPSKPRSRPSRSGGRTPRLTRRESRPDVTVPGSIRSRGSERCGPRAVRGLR